MGQMIALQMMISVAHKYPEHKKEFDYQHKYKYRTKLEAGNEESDLRVDRIEFYKKEQQKLEHNKKKIDNILLDLIDSGILSDNLDSINFDKIDADKLAETLKNTFGEAEYEKLIKEIRNEGHPNASRESTKLNRWYF